MTNLVIMTVAILIQVESDGFNNRIGDHGRAVGILQIHTRMVDEVNRVCKTKYTYADRYDPWKSHEMASKWLAWAQKKYKIDDPIELAYRWNKPRHGKVSHKYKHRIQVIERRIKDSK